MAESIKSALDGLFATYKKWIVTNPQLLSDVESTVKCLSYFSIGHFSNSSLALEIIYSIPNLVTLLNDMLIYHSNRLHPKIPEYESKIKIWLTVVEYTQTLLEVTGKKLGGEPGRWLIIITIQLFKAILRLLLVYVYKERMTKSPPVQPLNREEFNKVSGDFQPKEGFQLKRSGIVVRNLRHSDPVEIRTWKALPCNKDERENQNLSKNQEDKDLILAESLHVVKPLLYLGCASITSQQHWQPWMLSFLADLLSLHIYARRTRNTVLSKEDKQELARRKISLLLYILRSPFYEKYSCTKINAVLDNISTSVPFTKLITNSLKTQLSYIQSIYFYKW